MVKLYYYLFDNIFICYHHDHLVLLLKFIVELVFCDLVFLSLSNVSFVSFFVLVPTKSFTSEFFKLLLVANPFLYVLPLTVYNPYILYILSFHTETVFISFIYLINNWNSCINTWNSCIIPNF